MFTRILAVIIVLTSFLPTQTITDQTPPKSGLTLEWIFGDEGRSVASLPSSQWLADGKLMLYDGRLPPAQRAFEILDPATGVRRKAVEMKDALASLNALLPTSREVLSWPQSFDLSGRRALYVFNGDLFVLDLAKARFTRLTKSKEEEQSAEFSPDGNKLAFVRANDLYVLDLENLSETRLTRD